MLKCLSGRRRTDVAWQLPAGRDATCPAGRQRRRLARRFYTLPTDPVVTLSLFIGALCLAIEVGNLRKRERARAKAGGGRRGGEDPRDEDDGFVDPLRAPRQRSRRDYDEDGRYDRAPAPRQRTR